MVCLNNSRYLYDQRQMKRWAGVNSSMNCSTNHFIDTFQIRVQLQWALPIQFIEFIVMSAYQGRISYDSTSRYNALKAQLERETAALLNQRRQIDGIDGTIDGHLPQDPISNTQNFVEPADKTTLLVRKIQQIIALCKQENSLNSNEMQEVIKIENDILNYLRREQNGSHRQMPSSQHLISQKSIPSPPEASNQQRVSIRQRIQQSSKVALSDDVLEMIEEIQRKALFQIAQLLREKNALEAQNKKLGGQLNYLEAQINDLKNRSSNARGSLPYQPNYAAQQRLSEEVRLLSEQNFELRKRMDLTSNNLESDQLASQITVYENELRRAQQVIRSLQQRLSHYPQIQDLHNQGEVIRQDTVHLIKMKESRVYQGAPAQQRLKIKYLQERLEEEERGKQAFFNDLIIFKQKFKDLQEENRILKQSNHPSQINRSKTETMVNRSPQKTVSVHNTSRQNPNPPKPSAVKRSGLSQYEQTLNEMKKVINF